MNGFEIFVGLMLVVILVLVIVLHVRHESLSTLIKDVEGSVSSGLAGIHRKISTVNENVDTGLNKVGDAIRQNAPKATTKAPTSKK